MRLRYPFLLCSTIIIATHAQAQQETASDTTFLRISKTAIGISTYSLYFAAMAMNTLAADAYDTSRTADIKGVVQQSLDYFRATKNYLNGLKAMSENHGRENDAKRVGKIRGGFELLEKEAALVLKYIDAKTKAQKEESAASYRKYNASMMDLLDQIMMAPSKDTRK